MATDLFFTDVASGLSIDPGASDELAMSIGVRGNQTAGVGGFVNTVTGPTAGVQFFSAGGHPWVTTVWFSPPLAAVTISGTVTFNLWMQEANMTDNAGAQVKVERCDNAGNVISTIVNSERGVELSTSMAANNWTAAPTSTTLANGDRLKFTVYINDVGTMATGGSATFHFDRDTAGVAGDSYVRFTETIVDAPIPVSASDTLAAAATEASSYLVPILTDDPQAMTLGDVSTTLAVTVQRSDTLAASLGEAQQSLLFVDRTDSLAAAFSEVAAVVNAVTASDGLVVGITDAGTVLITVPVIAIDTLAVTVADGSAVAAQVSVTDALAMTMAEARGIASTLSRTDTLALAAVDVAATAVTVSTTDTASLAVVDTSTRQIGLSGADSGAVTVTESSTVQAALTRSDALSMTAAEGVPVLFVTLTRPDTLALTAGDVSALMVQQTSNDYLTPWVAETRSLVNSFGATDSLGLAGTEAKTLLVTVGRVDSLVVGVTDSMGALKLSLASADTLNAGAAETYLLLVSMAKADTLALGVTEDREMGGGFVVAQYVSAADVAALLAAEAVVMVRHGIRGRYVPPEELEMNGAYIGVPYTELEEAP